MSAYHQLPRAPRIREASSRDAMIPSDPAMSGGSHEVVLCLSLWLTVLRRQQERDGEGE